MLKGFKYQIYPNSEETILCEKHFGCTRLVYNMGLDIKKSAYRSTQKNRTYNQLAGELADLKDGFDFFKEVNSQSLQSSLKNLDTAYQNFFKHKAGFPKFKKKTNEQHFHCPQNVEVDFEKGKLILPKFKDPIQCEFHRRFKGTIKNATVSKTPSGKYFVSILVDTKEPIQLKRIIKEETTTGIDLNLKDTVVLSDGTKFKNPKILALHERKLKWLQHSFARMKKGSKRRERMRLRIAHLHEKIANCRKDFLHKTSHAITKRDDTLCMEDLAVSNMMKNHKLAKAIGDASWGELRRQITYKAEWRGKNILIADRWDATSKTCSCCGLKNENLKLDDRFWLCPFCFTWHDRDINAGINIKQFCLKRFWQTEHLRQDGEVSPLPIRKRKGMRADETSKFQDSIEPFVLYC